MFNGDAVRSMVFHKGFFPTRLEGRLSSVTEVNLKEGNLQEHVRTLTLDMPAAGITLEGPILKDKLSYLVSARRSWLDFFDNLLSEDSRMNHSTYDYNAKLSLPPVALQHAPPHGPRWAYTSWATCPRHHRSYYSIQPRFSLKYQPAEKELLYLHFSRMEQFYHNLRFDYLSLPTDFRMPSIDGFRPRSSEHYEVGWKHFLENGQLDVSAYYKTRRHVVALSPDTSIEDARRDQYIMTGNGDSYGAKAYFYNTWKRWTLQLSYAYTRSREWFPRLEDRGKLPSLYDIPHQLGAGPFLPDRPPLFPFAGRYRALGADYRVGRISRPASGQPLPHRARTHPLPPGRRLLLSERRRSRQVAVAPPGPVQHRGQSVRRRGPELLLPSTGMATACPTPRSASSSDEQDVYKRPAGCGFSVCRPYGP